MRPTYQIAARSQPSQGSKALPVNFDFSAAAQIAIDLLLEMQSGEIDFIQSVYVDNSLNPSPVTFLFPNATGLDNKLTVAARMQGYYPVNAPVGIMKFTVQSAGGVEVPCTFYNIEFPYVQWTTLPTTVPLSTGAYVDHSAAITGVDQIIIPANAGRLGYFIENLATSVNSIFINFGAAATAGAGSIEITPGGYWPNGNGGAPITTQAIHLIGTAGDKFTAKELV